MAADKLTPAHSGSNILKHLLRAGFTSDPALRLLAPLLPRCATVLMLHRFAMPDLGIQGHDPAILCQHLEYLRRRGYALLSMAELLDLVDGDIPLQNKSVVFTIDDGYADFAEVAAPIFVRYDCPVTVFLVTDFVAGRLWNWFDRVSWAFAHSNRWDVTIETAGERLRLRCKTPAERQQSRDEVVRRLKRVVDAEKEVLIGSLSRGLEVEIPERAPNEYKAMDWNEVRACSHRGVTFGPHTVTHPILSQVDDARAEREISESWRAVREGTDAAVPVFCYPNGGPGDFSGRDEQYVARAGMKAALSTLPGCVGGNRATTARNDRFSLPRFPYFDDKPRFVQNASGIEAMKTLIRKPWSLR
jgi:peptidoglycan/xylan/chitin deacetylase (PgdA/CDA1 family)